MFLFKNLSKNQIQNLSQIKLWSNVIAFAYRHPKSESDFPIVSLSDCDQSRRKSVDNSLSTVTLSFLIVFLIESWLSRCDADWEQSRAESRSSNAVFDRKLWHIKWHLRIKANQLYHLSRLTRLTRLALSRSLDQLLSGHCEHSKRWSQLMPWKSPVLLYL